MGQNEEIIFVKDCNPLNNLFIKEEFFKLMKRRKYKMATLAKGSTGKEVKGLQNWLNWQGFTDDNGNKLKEDGGFGDLTKQAVKKFQRAVGIKDDGIYGPISQRAAYNWGKAHPNGKQSTAPATSGKGPNWIALEEVIGTFNTAQELFNRLKSSCKYKYYYNSKFNNKTALIHIKTDGINCTNYCLLLIVVLQEMGYQVMIEHVQVKCNDGKWYGHYLLRINGKEYNNGSNPLNWTKFDAVSATKTGRPLGTPCCVAGFKHLGWGIK